MRFNNGVINAPDISIKTRLCMSAVNAPQFSLNFGKETEIIRLIRTRGYEEIKIKHRQGARSLIPFEESTFQIFPMIRVCNVDQCFSTLLQIFSE